MITDAFWQNLYQFLCGRVVTLEPLQPDHYYELKVAADHPNIWTYTLIRDFEEWFELILREKAQKQRCPYIVRRLDTQEAIGSTSYNEISKDDKHCSVGYTWYHPSMWGTEVNPDCMLTLLNHAFETLNLNRITFKTDLRNIRTQRAIEKLGAVREGVFRQDRALYSGDMRDTACYSILRSEWSKVKVNLEKRLSIPQEDTSILNQPLSDCA